MASGEESVHSSQTPQIAYLSPQNGYRFPRSPCCVILLYAVQSAQKINRATRRTKLVTHLARFVRYAREVRYFARKVRYFAREVRYLTRREILL